MAHLIESHDIGSAWKKLLYGIYNGGAIVSPRDMKTRELTNVTFHVENGLRNVMYSQTRDLNYRFMVAEWFWIQSGSQDLAGIETYNSVMSQFSDDGINLAGAYGPRLRPQWEYVFENLKKPASRQAVASIWTPNPEPSKDVPCTLSLQWMIRKDRVNCTVTMRSSDVWLGLPYDYFNFSQLTNVVSSSFGLPVGSMTMNLASSHLYETHWEKAQRLIANDFVVTYRSPQIARGNSIPVPEDLQSILKDPNSVTDLHKPWSDYADALKGKKHHAFEVLKRLSDELA